MPVGILLAFCCCAENSASLAEALRALMVARREQDNFQLIIITHDEHFAHLIGESLLKYHTSRSLYFSWLTSCCSCIPFDE